MIKNRINVIWNITRLCPFKCSFCCVSAIYIDNFRKVDESEILQYEELSFAKKIDILSQMGKDDFSIDFSGGDVLINSDNLKIIEFASAKFGKENIGLSIPGTFLDEKTIDFLENKVNDIEFTLDNLPLVQDKTRPLNYALITSKALIKLQKYNINVGVQTVLNHNNMNKETIYNLFKLLEELGIKKWSFLKFFPVGNFYKKTDYSPSDFEYIEIAKYINLITLNSNMKIDFQYLYPREDDKEFRCRAVKRSIGINAKGKISSCFWALDQFGEPLQEFFLGEVPKENIYTILESTKAKFWKNQSNTCNNCELLQVLDK